MLCEYLMTFLNPLVLLGLIATGIPVLLHLLSRRKLRTVDFSSLRFLKELQQTSMRRVKIRQILLLVLRIMLVAALVMAFARPVLRESVAGVAGSRAANTMVILVDDSPSMGVRNDRGELVAQARQAAKSVLAMVGQQDRVSLTALSATLRSDSLGPPGPAGPALQLADHITLSQVTVPMSRGMAQARDLLIRSRTPNREIYLITDGQASQFSLPEGLKDSIHILPDPPRVFLIRVPATKLNNAGIVGNECISRILTASRPVSIQATVKNSSDSPLKGAVVSAYLDGARVAQRSVDISPGSTSIIPFTVIPKRRGVLTGYFALEDDPLEADNKRYFTLRIPRRYTVALSGASAEETQYPYLALTLSGDTALTGGLTLDRIDPQRLRMTDIGRYDVLVLVGVHDFTPEFAQRISAFVSSGKGLLLFPGDAIDVQNYNETILPSLGIPSLPPVPPAISQEDRSTGSFISFGKIDFAHPVFSGLFEVQPDGRSSTPSIETPRIVRTIGASHLAGATTIIALGNGDPFLEEYRHGMGHVLYFTVGLSLTWSDFPLKGVFAPLLYRSLLYVAAGEFRAETFATGEPVLLRLPHSAASARGAYAILSPSGLEERAGPRYRASAGTLIVESSPAEEAGIYELRETDPPEQEGRHTDPLDAAAVNISPEETDLRPASSEDLERFWKALGLPADRVITVEASDRLPDVIGQSRYGVELWKFFAGLALLFALAEMLVGHGWNGRKSNQENQGSP